MITANESHDFCLVRSDYRDLRGTKGSRKVMFHESSHRLCESGPIPSFDLIALVAQGSIKSLGSASNWISRQLKGALCGIIL